MEDLMSMVVVLIIFVGVVVKGIDKSAKKNGTMGKPGGTAAAGRPGSSPAGRRTDSRTKGMENHYAKEFPGAASREPYQGSLGGGSMEGVDPCHDDPGAMRPGSLQVSFPEGTDPCHDDLHAVPAQSRPEAEPSAPPLSLSWAGSDIVKGFVYGEILNRKRA